MWLKGHHSDGLTWLGSLTGGRYERLVSKVHAIEIANRGHSLSRLETTGVVSTQYPHSGRHSVSMNHEIIRGEGQKA
jgi:hypothetical protein